MPSSSNFFFNFRNEDFVMYTRRADILARARLFEAILA